MRTFLFLSIFILHCISAFTQPDGETKAGLIAAPFHLGLQLGFTQGSARIDENPFAERYFLGGDFRGQLAPTFGMPLELQLGKHLSLNTGLHFLQRTALRDSVNINFTNEEFLNQIKFSLSFLNIPLMVQYRFGDEELQPFVQIGAQVGLPLSRKFEHTPNDPTQNYPTPDHRFKGFGTGYAAGIGVNKPLSSKLKLQVLGQYTRYASFFNHSIPAFVDGDVVVVSHVQVTGGLLWNLNQKQ